MNLGLGARSKTAVIAMFLSLQASPLVAQEDSPMGRPATCADFVGFWRVLPVTDPSINQVNPWPLPYQWFAFYEDGRVSSMMKTDDLSLTGDQLSEILEPMRSSAPTYRCDGPWLLIEYAERPNELEVWGKNLILREMSPEKTAPFEPGDIMMTLASPQDQSVIYFRHLRRLKGTK